MMIITGCLSSPDSNPLNTPITEPPPVATGILIITNPYDEPTIWGTVPDFNFGRNQFFSMYPNPTNYNITLVFSILEPPWNVTVEIVRAVGPLDELDQANLITGDAYFSQAFSIVRTLDARGWLAGGGPYFDAFWDLKDEYDNSIPAGFYRVYIRNGDYEIYGDILVAWSKEDLPPGFPVELTIFGNN
jgi:hypothetical protein